jgi:two-component system sensor histidine kinase HydH
MLIDDVALLVSSHPAYHKGITIENSVSPGQIFVQGLSEQLCKAFFNIILNACQAIGEKNGTISVYPASPKVNLFGSDHVVGVVIKDSGRGMNEQEIESLFTPFVSNRKSGVGLGMAITHSVVTRLGGFIEIDSAPGVGTSFSIYLKPANKNSENNDPLLFLRRYKENIIIITEE